MSGPDPLAGILEALLEQVRAADADDLLERLRRVDPAGVDRVLAGLVLAGEGVARLLGEGAEPPPAPSRARGRARA
ncbi:hypothetical protein [Janibacter melonis]|uniref:hypothetical protein n=1 Tax=Janibacter melonis TaxID=262209 RepID=UPI002094C49C|nr:hypothetical protein [Janibacter melonis]